MVKKVYLSLGALFFSLLTVVTIALGMTKLPNFLFSIRWGVVVTILLGTSLFAYFVDVSYQFFLNNTVKCFQLAWHHVLKILNFIKLQFIPPRLNKLAIYFLTLFILLSFVLGVFKWMNIFNIHYNKIVFYEKQIKQVKTEYDLKLEIYSKNILEQLNEVREKVYNLENNMEGVDAINKQLAEFESYIIMKNPRLSQSEVKDISTSVIANAVINNIDPNLIMFVIDAESDFYPNAVSKAGAEGLMQLMPFNSVLYNINPFDIKQNIMAGTRHLKCALDRFNGSIPLALAAYNAGTGRVIKAGNRIPQNSETPYYVRKIMNNYFNSRKILSENFT